MNVNPELLKILACPICKADVKLIKNHLECAKCGEKYPIKNGIPVMLPENSNNSSFKVDCK